MSDTTGATSDNPIESNASDLLERSILASEYVRDLRAQDASQGLVATVMGPWGSGKTSFINLMREHFEDEPKLIVLDFNPWLYSGSVSLVDVFFREIAAELRVSGSSKLESIAKGLDDYGDILSPVAMVPFVGAYFDRSLKSLRSAGKWWRAKKESGAKPLRTAVSDALAALDEPIVVVIDDIDRLTTEEIREIFKLFRLTASFPNIIYLLAFDRERVESALDEQNIPGRSYLEKIVQLGFDLPIPRESAVRAVLFDRLNSIIGEVENIRFDGKRWVDVYFEVVEPLIANLRDVSRFAISARSTLISLGSEIEVVDLVALEAIRIFRPELFRGLRDVRSELTTVSASFGSRSNEREKAKIDQLLGSAGEDVGLVKALVARVFPAGLQYTANNYHGSGSERIWRRNHLLAHRENLNHYFDRVASDGALAFRQAERAFEAMSSEAKFAEILDSIKPADLEGVISALETYEDEYDQEAVVPASTVLLNRISYIPDRPRKGMFDMMRPDLVVGRVIVRLLRTLTDVATRKAAVEEILEGVETWSSQLDLIESVSGDDVTDGLSVDEEVTDRLRQDFFSRVTVGSSVNPEAEWALLRVYYLKIEREGDSYSAPTIEDVAEIRALFVTGKSLATSSSMDSRSVNEELRLQWDALLRIFGSEEALHDAVSSLRNADGETEIVLLAEKYLSGWRPSGDW
ncbi:P-loop NTPase fold protein [Rathayibacter sp. AY1A7]|uniref:KAP family P-loop NTPase fold protein n=1 Tax=Rathayibacter sp. AY1A7 TaxID=2080524 RepID=UPI000CE938D5|nr:P-loop NTPase fold protein [Rathayibacter sp. AY1A7]PPF20876.1 NTPase KAP [Rathayibacter sp. AY1A7]